MDYCHYVRAQPARYRDESPVIRDRFYRARSDDGAESDSDGGRLPRRLARSRSPSYGSSDGRVDSEDDSELEHARTVGREYRDETLSNQVDVDIIPGSYTERLERDNMAMQQQLQDLHFHRHQDHASKNYLHYDERAFGPTTQQTHTCKNVSVDEKAHKARPSPAKVSAGPSLQVSRMKKKHQSYGEPKIVKDREAEEKDGEKDFSNKNLITVTREFDINKQYWRSSIEIFSPVFPRLVKEMPGFAADLSTVDGLIQMMEPFMNLFHNRQALDEAVQSEKWLEITDPDLLQARAHGQYILDFMRNGLGEISRKLDDIESDSPADIITYPEIWMLYKPGTVVYSLENGEYEAFVVDSLRGMQKRQRSNCNYSHTRLDLTCFSIDYDGEIFGRVWTQHCISPFRGAKNISSLNLVPEKFLPGAARIKASLLDRGRAFWSLQGQQYREYTGEMYSQHTNDEASRVMVDHLTYQRRNDWPIRINRKQGPSDVQSKNWKDTRFSRDFIEEDDWRYAPRRRRSRSPVAPPPDDINDWSPNDNGVENQYPQAYQRFQIERPAISAEDKYKQFDALEPNVQPSELVSLLCPQLVHGFCLREKMWKKFNVNELRPVAFRKNAWDRLVLDAGYKDIIQAMVSSYVHKFARLDDLIASKGNGLIVLLHGPPGSGKTLTAECVADAYSKPLYQVTCGDLGTDPMRLEARLEEVFDYAVTWGAILLLDEADIFLQDRDMESLERNALVSIFLRTLDYFSGILFLTTNRVTTFDQAFQSRIHVTLGVPALDQKRRAQVWKIFVDDLAAKNAIAPERHTLLNQLVRDQWSKQRLNGRQIRNAMRTALVLAEKKGTVLGPEEVAVVLRIGREFEGYLGQGKGVMGGLEGFEEVVEP